MKKEIAHGNENCAKIFSLNSIEFLEHEVKGLSQKLESENKYRK